MFPYKKREKGFLVYRSSPVPNIPITVMPTKTSGTIVSMPTATHVMLIMLFQCVAAVPLMAPVELALLIIEDSSSTPMSMDSTMENNPNIAPAFKFLFLQTLKDGQNL